MKLRYFQLLLIAVAVSALAVETAHADPCGMVPPIYVGNQSPITRIGLQKTYVFYKDGVESFVIRPGYEGNIDNFGMLIPFPTAPELRKVPDNVFEHISKAIDPPEVVVDLRIRRMRRGMMGAVANQAAPMANAMAFDSKESVRVLKQEAVGMYEVAVLAAGSAKALKRWLEKNKYQYPDGMEDVTNEYVDAGWCFVAVKTKVADKSAVQPKPGQRKVSPEIPKGSVFDGHVQGMGFRFKTKELVVPMRLSAFNKGDTRNVVYLLTDGPRKIRSIPEEYVVRQVSGKQLYDNLMLPLPLRIIGGTEADIPQGQRNGLKQRRNPTPHNGLAKDLFASDMLAVSSGQLSLQHEEDEKELLRIGEHLGLRGDKIDSENLASLQKARDKVSAQSIGALADMTLTCVDGDFPRQVIASENLTFAEYNMPANRNGQLNYDATRFGPGVKKEGLLKVGYIDWNAVDRQVMNQKRQKRVTTASAMLIAVLGIIGTVLLRRRPVTIAALLIAMGLMVSATAVAAPFQDGLEAKRSIKWGNYDLSVSEIYDDADGRMTEVGGNWMIVPEARESQRLLVPDSNKKFHSEGLEVTFSGYAGNPPPNVRMMGVPFEMVSLRKKGEPAEAIQEPAKQESEEQASQTATAQMKLPESVDEMMSMLRVGKTAKVAIAAIDQHCKKDDDQRDAMVKNLLNVVRTDSDLPARGWAIAALAEVGGQDVDEYLLNIHADGKQEMVVRTWAAAARVSMTRTVNGLIEKANLINQFPALGRPIGMRLVEKMQSDSDEIDVNKVLEVSMKVPQLSQSLAPMIMNFGPEDLIGAMYSSKDDNARRQAAGYLGAIANQGKTSEVAELVNSALKFDADAEQAPWAGGALFVPGIQWGKEEANMLVSNLLRWHLWCDLKNDANGQNQIHNNLRGVGLSRVVGYQSPGWNSTGTVTWLEKWGDAKGKAAVEEILKEQGVEKKRKYRQLLDRLK